MAAVSVKRSIVIARWHPKKAINLLAPAVDQLKGG